MRFTLGRLFSFFLNIWENLFRASINRFTLVNCEIANSWSQIDFRFPRGATTSVAYYKDSHFTWPGPVTRRSIRCPRMCRYEVQERDSRRTPDNRIVDDHFGLYLALYTITTRLTVASAIRVPRDNITSSPRPGHRRPPPASFNPVFLRRWHAREDRCIARWRLSGRTRAATHLRRRSLARPLTCTSTRGSVWRATDCSRAPTTPFITVTDHGPAAPLVRSRSPRILALRPSARRETGPSRGCRSTLCASNFLYICGFLLISY